MYYQDNEENFSVLVGKTIKTIKQEGKTGIIITCSDGQSFEMYHMQDCCESVMIHDIDNSLDLLIDEEIVLAEKLVSDKWPQGVGKETGDSFTWTTFVFYTAKNRVAIRWLGTSNGYYSESVYFGRVSTPIELKENI